VDTSHRTEAMPSSYDENPHDFGSRERTGFGPLFWTILFVAVLISLW